MLEHWVNAEQVEHWLLFYQTFPTYPFALLF
jgi:hypothetical protein